MSARDAKGNERKAFKDWFDRSAAKALAEQIRKAWPRFDQAAFVRSAARKLDELEFAARVQQFSNALALTLPSSIPRSLEILTDSLPEPQNDCDSVTDGWLQWPLGKFIADHGLDHFDESMTAMVELTKRFSSEFAVRPFVQRYPDKTIQRLLELTADRNPHVRRWCSEGVRPRLPWGIRLIDLVNDPTPIFPILERLKDDNEEYVRRSVANNLNDVAKDHPDLVIRRCKAWRRNSTSQRDWVINHALRSLVKEGAPEALELVGFKPPRGIRAKVKVSPKRIVVGESAMLEVELRNTSSRTQNLLVDYIIHFVRQRGRTTAVETA